MECNYDEKNNVKSSHSRGNGDELNNQFQTSDDCRWDTLYKLNKVQQMKLENERKRIQTEVDDSQIKECTFTPQLCKYPKYLEKSKELPSDTKEQEQMLTNDNMLTRQETWMKKKQTKIEELKQSQKNKLKNELNFQPEINSIEVLERLKINTKIENIVEDPESYLSFMKRMEKLRKENNDTIEKNQNLPGNGKVWKTTRTKINNYNYMKHALSPSKTLCLKSITSTSTKNTNSIRKKELICSNKLTDYLCSNRSEKDKKKVIKIDDHTKYGNALNTLHRELFSIKLMDDY